MNNKEIAQYIDHTYLKPEGTKKHIKKLIHEAIKYNFKTVCIHPSWVKYAKEQLKDSSVKITTVIGFPLGACNTQVKVFEAKLALDHGADEIDMVINIGRLKDHQNDYVLNEIKKVKEICKSNILKVIIETSLLSKEEKYRVIEIINSTDAEYIKTSTGFSYGGATVEDVKLIKSKISKDKFIKASGNIKTLSILKDMIEAGANRIGTSSGVAILSEIEG